MSDRKGDWIQTFTGGQFWPLDPRTQDIHVEDVAHALSNQGRFSGHTREFYSVAQHAVYVSLACDPRDANEGLHHDDPEAYLVDLARPLKHLPGFRIYRDAEEILWACVALRFDLRFKLPASVKAADEMLLATEVDHLMQPRHKEWGRWIEGAPRYKGRFKAVGPKKAERMYLDRYLKLTGGRRSWAPGFFRFFSRSAA